MGKQVDLTYKEHRGIPTSCFGDTKYYVTNVRVLGGNGQMTPPMAPTPPANPANGSAPAPR